MQLALHFCQSSWQKDTSFVMQKKLFNVVCQYEFKRFRINFFLLGEWGALEIFLVLLLNAYEDLFLFWAGEHDKPSGAPCTSGSRCSGAFLNFI